jgi:hypothetical protein
MRRIALFEGECRGGRKQPLELRLRIGSRLPARGDQRGAASEQRKNDGKPFQESQPSRA